MGEWAGEKGRGVIWREGVVGRHAYPWTMERGSSAGG